MSIQVRKSWRRVLGLAAVAATTAALCAAVALAPAASAQSAGDVALRDQLIANQENLLNTYRCRFNVDVGAVPGGCPNPDQVTPGVAPQNPTQQDIDVRDGLIANQEALLNVYRCRFDVDTEIVPGGCVDGAPAPEPLPAPPAGRYDPFYTQWVQVGPMDVIAPAVVDPAALRQVAATIEAMLANRPDIIKEMARHVYVVVAPSRMKQGELPEMKAVPQAVFDAWGQPDRLDHEVVGGFGPSIPALPFVLASADNALCTANDSHPDEDVVVHEFAHGIHAVQRQVDSSFDADVLRLYEDAIAAGLWAPSHYAATNHDEYFAEVFQSWADVNSRDDGFVHNPPIATAEEVAEHDPDVAAFMTEWFGHIELTSNCHRDPAARDKPVVLPEDPS